LNKTVVFVTFAVLAGLGIAGGVFIMVHRPDATAAFTTLLITVLGLVTTSAGVFYGLGKANDKIEEVRKQTNGNNSRLQERNEELASEVARLSRLLHPDQTD
jgi:hypothetical protein